MLTSQEIEFFVNVASSKSLAAAARKMDVTPPSVSQRLQLIEKKLETTLVERSSRAISLTAEGETLAKRGRVLLNELMSLEEDISATKESISGLLRITSPIGLAIQHIGPIVSEFQLQYPHIKVELEVSDAPKWQTHNSPDLMLYIGHLQDSNLKRVKLRSNRRMLLAAPKYLKSAPPLNHPNDLVNHRCIVLRENDEDATMWRFLDEQANQTCSVRVKAALSSNVGQVIKDWCIAGGGVMRRSHWDVVKELESGELVHLLPDFTFPEADMVALLATESKSRPKKVQVFLDFMKEHLGQRLDITSMSGE
ncbi:LysR family transcriptional regulator [Vibrio sp. T187]|uniref:LysR substrate-binding domain-containing protein n=1 Tax=Vibrio TaxID=662 RepID=UPI0010C9FFED|nr:MULTISPECIES: LysR substrate-binding domain-containing protein [Vibrio]MBW3696129.1 LysR family transcriptional regulator [Vibrio sp. T187]